MVLDWNEGALDFYLAHGVECKREWLLHRVEDDKLRELAALPLE